MGRRHDDASLVQRARAGSADALNELFDRYFPAVWKAAYRVTGSRALADDAVQEAFVRAFAALDTFDERRPLEPWLARIAVNRSIDLVRSERRLQPVDPGDLTRLERPYEEVRGESATAGRCPPRRRAAGRHRPPLLARLLARGDDGAPAGRRQESRAHENIAAADASSCSRAGSRIRSRGRPACRLSS